jgi:hypothetical protein
MQKASKILIKIISGSNDSNIDFHDLVDILIILEFDERIKGSHHIFSKSGIREIINLQPGENNKCKAYQVKQVRNILLKYKLVDFENE